MLCGITFPIAMLPTWAQATSLAMPPTYIVEGMRSALLRSAGPADLVPAAASLIGLAIAFTVLAVVVFRWLEASARRSGMLGRY
jgi:ABC-2 type transport system permease protein